MLVLHESAKMCSRMNGNMLQTIKKIPALRRWYQTRNSPIKLSRFKADLAHAVKKNRQSLALVPHWLDEDVYRASIFQYGLPPHIREFIDDPIDESPTYSDLIVHLAGGMRDLRYLELGPSVGKNLFQVAKAVQNSELVAVDIEDINPILEQQLTPKSHVSWTTMPGSKRSALSTQTAYGLDTNNIGYIAGDLFDSATWDRLRGRKFNMIFSDAFHSPEALIVEWENIARLGLLASGPFAMVWDDLTSDGMRQAFYRIATAIRRDRPSALASLELFQGWVGKRESLHPIGIVRGPE
jgi:hypothetical protein